MIEAVLETIEAAYDQGVTAINTKPPSAATFAAMTLLAGRMRELADVGADYRARIAGDVWDAKKLSLAALADHIGVSKARADQLIRNAKKLKDQEGP